MKKTFRFTVLLMAAGILAACTEKEAFTPEDNPETSKEAELVEMTFTAGVDTKAAFNEDLSKILWQPKDKICIYSTDGTTVFSGEFNEQNLTSESECADFKGTAYETSSFYAAVYPFASASGCDAEAEVTVIVPEIQTAVKGSFDPAASVAVAYTTSKDDRLYFKNICGWLGFEIAEEYEGKVKSITLTATSGTVAGTVNVNVSGEGTPSLTADAEASSRSVSIATASAETGLASGKYYMSVLPGDIAGFEITVEFMDGRIGTKSTTSTLKVVHNTYGTVMTVSESALDFKTEVVEVEAESLSEPIYGWQHTYWRMKPFCYLYGTGFCDGGSEHWQMFDGDFNTAWLTYKTNESASEKRFGDPFIVIDLKKPYMIDQFGVGIDRNWGEYCRPANIEFWVTNEDPSLELTNDEARLLSNTGNLETTNYDAYLAVDKKIRAHLKSMTDREAWRVACGSQPFDGEWGHGYCENGTGTDHTDKTWGDHYHYMTTQWNIKPEEKATYRYVCLYMKLPAQGSDLHRERNRIREFCLKRYTWYNGYKFN